MSPAATPPRRLDLAEVGPRAFRVIDPGRCYQMTVAGVMASFDFDRAHWDRNELTGELRVSIDLLGTDAIDGVLTHANFNVSSARARTERATLLQRQARTSEIPWHPLLEEFCQRILAAERTGPPAVSLRSLPRPTPDDTITIDGLPLIDRHPTTVFGDGGAAKSYLALYLGGRLAQQGIRPVLFDWELAAEDHRDRLERLFGPEMPEVLYVRCDRPLAQEVDRLRRICRDEEITYGIYDSVAFACDGPPEAAEVAGRYFQAVRQIGVGSLHVAHVSKAETGDQKPFGSAFWHNGSRATWNVKLAETMPGSQQITIGLYNRKSNLSGIRPPVGFDIIFDHDRTLFRKVDVGDVADLAGHLSVRQRMAHLLRRGALSPERVAEEIQADVETVRRTARRYKQQFTAIPNGHLALVERRTA